MPPQLRGRLIRNRTVGVCVRERERERESERGREREGRRDIGRKGGSGILVCMRKMLRDIGKL